jgi:uncharacterized protein with beta-barrel porin domain
MRGDRPSRCWAPSSCSLADPGIAPGFPELLIVEPALLVSVVTLSNQFALSFASDNSTNVRSELGLRGDKSFTVNGARPAADGALVTAGAEMKWRNGWALAGTFEGEFSRTTDSYAGKGTVKHAW